MTFVLIGLLHSGNVSLRNGHIKKGRNIALQALFPLRNRSLPARKLLREFRTLGLLLLPLPSLQGAGEAGGVSGCTWCCVWGGAPSPLARPRSSERGGSASGHSSGARSRFSFSFRGGRSGSCPLTADPLFPRLRLGCLSRILTARSTTWEFERDFGVLLPLVILPWFPFFGSRSTGG